jgi:hypothetical protein
VPASKDRKTPDPHRIACDIRERVGVLASDLELIRKAAAHAPGCAEAIQRVNRQVAEIGRLADELCPPK